MSKLTFVIVVFALISMSFTGGAIFENWRTPPVIVIKTIQVPVYVEKVVEKRIVGPATTTTIEKVVYVPKAVVVTQMVDPVYTVSSNDSVSIDEVLKVAAIGKYNHQYFVENPTEQTERTGDTAFNIYWVKNYTWIEDVVKAQQNRITELERQALE